MAEFDWQEQVVGHVDMATDSAEITPLDPEAREFERGYCA